MSAGDIHSILYRGEDPLHSKFKPKILEQKKIQRYWPGKAPDFAPNVDEEAEYESPEEADVAAAGAEIQEKRLLRLSEIRKGDTAEARSDARRDRVTIDHVSADEIAKTPVLERGQERGRVTRVGEEEASDLEDETIEERRNRLRSKLLKKRQLEEEAVAQPDGVDEFIEEEFSESEAESDDDEPSIHTLLKPVFVPKSKRDTVKEKIELELEEKQRQEAVKQKLKSHKQDSQRMVIEMIKNEKNEVAFPSNDTLVDNSETELLEDEDDSNEAEEYELWKVREIKRIKRDKESLEARGKFLAEIERRRQLTEEERRQDDKHLDLLVPKQEKKHKQLFMQKYYHKGAFFQDKAQTGEEEIYLRDFHAPVGEDLMNKKILPKAMRLRRGQFGRAGQVKHTHLVDVDTTDFSVPWATNDAIRHKDQSRMAGYKDGHAFERPKAKGKLK